MLARASDSPLSVRLPALVNLASVCGEQGKLDEAEKFFRQALKLSPNHPRVSKSFAFFLADHNLKLDEALALSRLAVQAEPNNADYLDTLGWVQFQRGELADSEATLKKALALAGQEPPAPEIREHLKKVQEKKGTAPK
jgi:Tfp pilus assembly protein PilF